MYKICRFMRHSGPAAFEPAHFFVSFLCANKEMKNTFTMLFLKAKSCVQRNEKYFYLAFSEKLKNNFYSAFRKSKNILLSFLQKQNYAIILTVY